MFALEPPQRLAFFTLRVTRSWFARHAGIAPLRQNCTIRQDVEIWGNSSYTFRSGRRWLGTSDPTQRKGVDVRTIKWVTVAVAIVAAMWLAVPALAQQYPPRPNGGTEGAGEERGGQAEGTGAERGGVEAGELAFTGADLTMYVVIGLVAVGSGILILRRAKLNRANSSLENRFPPKGNQAVPQSWNSRPVRRRRLHD
jgi:hypothetical protein